MPRVRVKLMPKLACSATWDSLKNDKLSHNRITKAWIRMGECAGWSALLLFAKPEDGIFFRRLD